MEGSTKINMKSSRTINTLKNSSVSLITNFISMAIGVLARWYFVKILGKEVLGLNGLFTNIISMLSIVELGFGSAITYNLYKPIANNNIEEIKSLMEFYKKCYHAVAIVIMIIGILLIPFLNSIVGENQLDLNIYFIYGLFILETASSYFLSYKRSILYANQENFIINLCHIGYLVLMNLTQVIFLIYTKNYYIYLIIKIFFRIMENIIINYYANKKYTYLQDKKIEKLSLNIKKDIEKKVKALFFHQTGSFIINGTDNIIISKYINLTAVGLYSNYYFIINSIQNLIRQIIKELTPSVGNLLVTESKEKAYDIFKKTRFITFWIVTFTGIGILLVASDFVSIWLGKEYILTFYTVLVLAINYYQKTSRMPYSIFKEAAGIFYEDRFIPIIESLINIVSSILLVKVCGLPGVFIGTIISGLVLWLYSYPILVYKKIFDREIKKYYFETIKYLTIFLFIMVISIFISNLPSINNIYIKFIYDICISIIIPNLTMYLLFRNSEDYIYLINIAKKIINKKRNKKIDKI